MVAAGAAASDKLLITAVMIIVTSTIAAILIALPAGIHSSSSSSSDIITPSPAPSAGGCFSNIDSIFSFGDSITDTGNHCHLLAKAGKFAKNCFPPYGDTFFHTPTGRSSNGRIIIDFLAEHLGLPLVPPYFGGSGKETNYDGGVNFAVGTATALDSDFIAERVGVKPTRSNISLRVQLDLFKQLLPSLCSGAAGNTSGCTQRFKNSLFLLGEIGGNDYNFLLLAGHSLKDVQELVPLDVDSIISALKEIIEVGAVNILVPGNFPIGCLPMLINNVRGSYPKDDFDASTGCLTSLNTFAEYHNEHLQIELNRTRHLYPHVNIFYVDYYNAVLRLYRAPKQFGFNGEALTPCCGGEGTGECGSPSARLCEDPSKYVNWDGEHFTEATYRLIVNSIFEGLFTNPHFNASSCIARNSGKYFPSSF